MDQSQFHFPFINTVRRNNQKNYFVAIQSQFFPNFKLLTISTALLSANIIIFILIHILFKPKGYQSFLQFPHEMDKWLLQVQMVKTNKSFLYQAVTAMFMHQNYLHIANNLIFGLFIMYEMQFCYVWSIPTGLLAGFLANCLAVLTLQGRILGFSGVLCSYVGMMLVIFVTHITYLENRGQGFIFSILLVVILFSLVLMQQGGSFLPHLYGYLFGVALALAFQRNHKQSCINENCQKILKILCLVIIVVVIVLVVLL